MPVLLYIYSGIILLRYESSCMLYRSEGYQRVYIHVKIYPIGHEKRVESSFKDVRMVFQENDISQHP
jgi:hypothetical protein